ncbi:TPA: hypothetical protein J4Z58_001448 [Escherichia coli]|nr:hypothetical protein [Escherichia coli]
MSVKRYEVNGTSSVFEDANGSLVDYEDYAALEQRLIESERYGRQTDITIDNLEMKLAQMAAENAGLKQAITTHSQSTHFCEVCGKDDPCSTDDVCYVLNETPATDAFLAEVRASAIEHAAAERWGSGYIFNELNELAAQIRKGVQS